MRKLCANQRLKLTPFSVAVIDAININYCAIWFKSLLIAMIRLGDCAIRCIGDPACDLVIAWTLFSNESRDAFCAKLKLDTATWARARGWALWKALCWVFPGEKRVDWRVVNELLADHRRDYE